MSKRYGDDDFDGLGEVVNYVAYTPPPAPRPPAATPYNTVSDDERATSGSAQQPKKEFSIWDSVAKPSPKTRTPTRVVQRSSSKRKVSAPPRRLTSSNHSDSNNPPAQEASTGNNQAPQVPEQAHDTSSSFLWIAGGVLLLVLAMKSGN